MSEKELIKARVKLYKATPLKLKLADKVAETIRTCFGTDKIETNGLRFDSGAFKLGGLTVKMVDLDKQSIGNVLIHWVPDFKISTNSDPFCAIYMLHTNEIKKLLRKVRSIKAYSLLKGAVTNVACEVQLLATISEYADTDMSDEEFIKKIKSIRGVKLS